MSVSMKELVLEAIERSHYKVSDFVEEVFPQNYKPVDDELARCDEWDRVTSMHGMRRMRDVS